MAKAIDVANFLVFMAQNESEPDYLTPMRLQKLMYYCQGWSLALRDGPLFPERIEAWAYGPVVPDVFEKFKDYRGPALNFESDQVPDWELTDDEVIHTGNVWTAYKNHSATGLWEMTRREKPWIKARNGLGPLERSEAEIPLVALKKYFDRKAKKKMRKKKPKSREIAVLVGGVSRLHTPVSVTFRYAEKGGRFCLSRCTSDEVREIVDCLRQLSTLTWQQVLNTGGKGGSKAGLGFTQYDDSALKGVSRPLEILHRGRIFGIRASQKIRIFAIYDDHIVHLLWFDRNHEIVPV